MSTETAATSTRLEPIVMRHGLKRVGPFILDGDPFLSPDEVATPTEAEYRPCEWCHESATCDLADTLDGVDLRKWFVDKEGLSVCDECLVAYDNEMTMNSEHAEPKDPVDAVVMRALVRAAVRAFAELNAIRARDGVPYNHNGGKSDVQEEYFSSVVDGLDEAVKAATGKSAHCHPELYE